MQISEVKNPVARSLSTVFVAAALLIVVLIVWLSPLSYAWFSSNRQTEATGMSVRVETMGNLVISSTSDISSESLSAIGGGSPFRVPATADAKRYLPASHHGDFVTGLRYVTNSAAVGLQSGVKKEDATLIYAAAKNDESAGSYFYKDVTVYVAAFSGEITGTTLSAKISATKTTDDGEEPITKGTLMATSVDFYQNSVSVENYKGTLNVAGSDASVNDYDSGKTFNAGATKTSLYLVGGEESRGTIPHNTEGHLTYVMRIYFDGALQSAEGQAYVNAKAIDPSKINLKIEFYAD